jgi:restriction endonuclease S subunit
MEEYLISLGKGPAQPCISMEKLKSIKIPIPSLERQQEIVEYCEYNDALIKKLEKEIENNKKYAEQFIMDILKTRVNNGDA